MRFVPVWMPLTLEATSRFETNVPSKAFVYPFPAHGTAIFETSSTQGSKLVHTQFVLKALL